MKSYSPVLRTTAHLVKTLDAICGSGGALSSDQISLMSSLSSVFGLQTKRFQKESKVMSVEFEIFGYY